MSRSYHRRRERDEGLARRITGVAAPQVRESLSDARQRIPMDGAGRGLLDLYKQDASRDPTEVCVKGTQCNNDCAALQRPVRLRRSTSVPLSGSAAGTELSDHTVTRIGETAGRPGIHADNH